MTDKNGILIACTTCRHLDKLTGFICTAFPNGIPPMLADNSMVHDQILPGQEGKILWDPNDYQLRMAAMKGHLKG